GMFAATGVLAALRDAERTGHGRRVDVSLFDAQLAWLANRASEYLAGGVVPERYGNAHPVIVPYQSFRARDGFLILAIGTDDQFARFCAAAGLDELAADSRFRTNPERVENRRPLVALLADAIVQRSLDEWLGVLARARVPGGPVRSIPETL